MSLVCRLPIIATSPILSSPLRSCLRPHRWRPPSPVVAALPQRHNIHLWVTANSKTVLGMYKILNFDLYEEPARDSSSQRINIWEKKKGREVSPESGDSSLKPEVQAGTDNHPTLIAKDITLEEAYRDYIGPGKILVPHQGFQGLTTRTIKQLMESNFAAKRKDYFIKKASAGGVPVKLTAKHKGSNAYFKTMGMLKESHFTLSSPTETWFQLMARSYYQIAAGHPLEFHFRIKNKKVSKEVRLAQGPVDQWPYLHDNFPHIRPDFILRSMPEGTQYMIKPFSNGHMVAFVLSLPSTQFGNNNYTKRLLKVKKAVEYHLRSGNFDGVPATFRDRLKEEWKRNYSVESSMRERKDDMDTEEDGETGEANRDLWPRKPAKSKPNGT